MEQGNQERLIIKKEGDFDPEGESLIALHCVFVYTFECVSVSTLLKQCADNPHVHNIPQVMESQICVWNINGNN